MPAQDKPVRSHGYILASDGSVRYHPKRKTTLNASAAPRFAFRVKTRYLVERRPPRRGDGLGLPGCLRPRLGDIFAECACVILQLASLISALSERTSGDPASWLTPAGAGIAWDRCCGAGTGDVRRRRRLSIGADGSRAGRPSPVNSWPGPPRYTDNLTGPRTRGRSARNGTGLTGVRGTLP